MRKSFKYRLWTNANQRRELSTMLETHRRLYNAALAERKAAWESEHRTVRFADQSAGFTQTRRDNPWYQRINVSSAQQTLRRLDRAYQAFFRRVKAGDTPGYPRFKSADRFDSVTFATLGDGVRLVGPKLYVQFVGTMRVKWHRPVGGTIKTVTVKREGPHWYAVFSCELPDEVRAPHVGPTVGVDVGLEHFLTTSDGEHVANPRLLREALPALRRTQRSLSRKVKGSARRRKTREQVRRLHATVRNQRREFHWRVARQLVQRYGLIVVERLSINGMLRSRRFSRSIADAAWGGFLDTLEHLAASAGARVVRVECRGTSQACSSCGIDVPKPLRERRHRCPACGYDAHRDVNAARNVLLRATGADGASGTQAHQ